MKPRFSNEISVQRGSLRETIRKIVSPTPQDQEKQGFEPNFYIRFLRRIAAGLIFLLRLNGRNRFSNEFIQLLDPRLAVELPAGGKLIFRTGHGRLLWRAQALFTEEPMVIEWIDRFTLDDCFYDVGANVGNYSLYAARRGIKVLAFEPEYNNLALLYENVFLNRLQEECMPIPVALGDETKIDIFYLKSVSKGDALHSIGRKSYLLGDPSSVTCALDTLVARLDDLIPVFGLPKPTKIKIDVDNNELNVVRGADKTLNEVQEVYIELDLKVEEHRQVMDILEGKSFRLYRKEGIPRQWNTEIANYLFVKR